ncbi:MAG: S-layer homology domain-containing protein [Chloroflexota bacterium]|nr:S-layer homology domain-containing protein [Chloroflexota bacterium]
MEAHQQKWTRHAFKALSGVALLLAVAGQVTAPALARPVAQGKTPAAPSATYVVTNTNNSGQGSLRQAIFDANANPGHDTISFNIPGEGVQVIMPAAPLPPITDPVTLDGTTQPGYAGTPIIQLNGSAAGAVQGGLVVSAGSSTIRGLVISNFDGAGIKIDSVGGNTIEGNYIGTDPTGAFATPNTYGILVQDVPTNTIGGTTAAQRNLISSNATEGIIIQLSGSHGNVVQGNYIGTNATGDADRGNSGSGILVRAGAHDNTIGGAVAGAGNLISGNNSNGITFDGANGGNYYNLVQGNYIGTNAAGTAALGNNGAGIYMYNFVIGNTIGGVSAASRNLISGNLSHGIYLNVGSANDIYGNYIGTNATGTAAIANMGNGVYMRSAYGTEVGASLPGGGNLISGNTGAGVASEGTDCFANDVRNNYIGTDVSGSYDLGNGSHGVFIGSGCYQSAIGGSASSRNLISGNNGNGVYISGASVQGDQGNFVRGNFIGTTITGTAKLGNSLNGVLVENSPFTTIGNIGASPRNLISGNDQNGIVISGTLSHHVTVQNNYIGTNISGTMPLGNLYGIEIRNAPTNTIGGMFPEVRNLISGNYNGIFIRGNNATYNRVIGNYIGTDVTGTSAVSNEAAGVVLYSGAKYNTIGGGQAGERNVISANGYGVILDSNTTSYNKVQGNYIGVAADGTSPLGSLYYGISIGGAYSNTIGGGVGLGNIIANSLYDGVSVQYGAGNVIYTNSTYGNGRLGIDLGDSSVTPNDPLDADTGGNNLQNFPVLSAASNATEIRGSLNSTPNTTFTIELFSNTVCNALGHGEGRTFVGTTSAATLANGNANFTFSPDQALPGGSFITATATDPNGNSSEFSACLQLPGGATATSTSTSTSTTGPSSTSTATRTSTAIPTSTATYTSVPASTSSSTATRTSTASATSTTAAGSTATSTTVAEASATATRTATSTTVVNASATATRTATATSVPASSTPVQPSATATQPASNCNIQFTDVPVGSTFYQYVQCLACRGILGGYADGTFRSNNDVTRGQLSKIVANAAGFTEPVSGETFTDVPADSPFYAFIERMARRGIIGGYADGAFRPNNNATRGQISKIVANAAGYNEPVSGQTFTDVTPDSPFYVFIERMVGRDVIGGYADGTFRPNNNATRGQVAKIVSNAFFPNCLASGGDAALDK